LLSSPDFHPASIWLHHFARTSFIVKQFQFFLLKSSIIFPICMFQSSVEGLPGDAEYLCGNELVDGFERQQIARRQGQA